MDMKRDGRQVTDDGLHTQGQLAEAFDEAVGAGINFFDTAEASPYSIKTSALQLLAKQTVRGGCISCELRCLI